MSGAATVPPGVDVEEGVRSRSQYAHVVHRADESADEPRPACSQALARDVEYREVAIAALLPIYDLCRNEECFGGDLGGQTTLRRWSR